MKQILSFLFAALLVGCSTTTGDPEAGIKLSTSIVYGFQGDLEGADEDHIVGARVQVRRTSNDFPAWDLGFRLGFTDEKFSESGAKTDAYVFNAAPSVRYTFPLGEDSPWRPYVEGFVGYAHAFTRVEVAGVSARDNGGGLFGGVGAGVEITITNTWAVHAGIENTWADYSIDGNDLDERVFQGFAGVTFTF